MPGPEPLLIGLAATLSERYAVVAAAARAALPPADAVGIPDLGDPGVMSYDVPALAIENFPAICLALDDTPRIIATTPDERTGAPRLEVTTQLRAHSYVRTDLGYEATARMRDRVCLIVRTCLLSRPRLPVGVIDLADYREAYRDVVPVQHGRTLAGTVHTVRIRTVEVVDDRWVLDPEVTEGGVVGLPAEVVLDPTERLWPTGHPSL